jgi:two-component system, LytTR family, response regulator
MIRTLIVDDEPLARSGIVARLKKHSDCQVIGECSSAEDAAEQMRRYNLDLVFLDICMTGITGIELLDSMSRDAVPAIIFLTAHEQYAVEAFRHEALDYLLKPIDDERFDEALDRARRFFDLRERAGTDPTMKANQAETERQGDWTTRFTVTTHRRVQFISAADIDWIEGLGDYAGLHVGQSTHLIRTSLNFLERRLDPADFLRIHRSAIVNTNRLQHIVRLANQDSVVTLTSGSQLRSSRTYYAALKKLMSSRSLS